MRRALSNIYILCTTKYVAEQVPQEMEASSRGASGWYSEIDSENSPAGWPVKAALQRKGKFPAATRISPFFSVALEDAVKKGQVALI